MLNDGILASLTSFFNSIWSLFTGFVVPGFKTMTPADIIIGIFAFGVSIMLFKTLFNEFAHSISISGLRGEGKQHLTDSKRMKDER